MGCVYVHVCVHAGGCGNRIQMHVMMSVSV